MYLDLDLLLFLPELILLLTICKFSTRLSRVLWFTTYFIAPCCFNLHQISRLVVSKGGGIGRNFLLWSGAYIRRGISALTPSLENKI